MKYYTLLLFFLCGTLLAEEVVIIGSGPAGLSSAIYTARAGLETLIIEGHEPGGQIALSESIENMPGVVGNISGFELAQNMRKQALNFGAKIQKGTIVSADLSSRPFQLQLENGKWIQADTLMIASGAATKWLGLPSEKALIGRGVSSCAVCDGALYKNQEVVVVGGGDAAIEDALYLAKHASKVNIIHRRDELRANPYLQQKAIANPKIHFIWNHVIESIDDPKAGFVKNITLKNVNTNKLQTIPTDGVFIAIGHTPNTELFKNQLELDTRGFIVTEQINTKTSISGVFAAGDVADRNYQQVVTASSTGGKAGMDVFAYLRDRPLDPK